MDEILHPEMLIPLQIPTNNGFNRGFKVVRIGLRNHPQYGPYKPFKMILVEPKSARTKTLHVYVLVDVRSWFLKANRTLKLPF